MSGTTTDEVQSAVIESCVLHAAERIAEQACIEIIRARDSQGRSLGLAIAPHDAVAASNKFIRQLFEEALGV